MPKQAQTALAPKLRFPEFRNGPGWKQVALDQLAGRVTTRNLGGDCTRVLTNSAEHGVVDQRDYFDKDIATAGNLEGYHVVDRGDYVYNPRISNIAPVGPISRNNLGQGVMSPLYTVFRFKNENTDFYAHYFKTTCWHSYLRQVASTGARHDRMSISVGDFAAMPLPAPTPAEQQKIASCLSSVDELMAAQALNVDALKAHKKGLMQQLFPREGETTPNFCFGVFPDPWKEVTLGDIATTTIGEFVIKTKQHPDAPYPVFNGGRSHTGFYDQYNNEGNKILISARGANAGHVNIIRRRYWAGNSCYSVAINDRNVSLNFAYWFMKRNESIFIERQHAANIPAVSKGQVESFKIMLPAPEEQQRIADCLSALDDLIAAEAQKLDALKTHKKGLMQQLFASPEATGPTRVSPLRPEEAGA